MSKMLFRVILLSAVLCVLAMPQSARAAIEDGLISYWPFDEGSGTTTADASGVNTFDGTLQGSPTWVSGMFGNALEFDNDSANYVLITERSGSTSPGTYPAELMPDHFTVSCWTKLDEFIYFTCFMGNGHDNGDDECGFYFGNFGWEDESGQDFVQNIRTQSGMYYIETANIYSTETWYHLVTTYDGQYATLYVNGAVAAGPTDVGGPMLWISATTGNYPDRLTLGKWEDPGYDLAIDGILDDVAYWDRALIQAEVTWLYNGGTGNPVISPHVVDPIAPANGAQNTSLETDLSWTLPVEFTADYYDLWFGTDPNLTSTHVDWKQVLDKEDQNSWDPPHGPEPNDLALETTYYWQVDVYDPNNGEQLLHVGPKWSFRTIGTDPIVETHPEDQLIDDPGTAAFTVGGLNIDLYEWFKSDDPNNNTSGDDTGKGSGAAMETLTLVGATSLDEGYYYCKVSNDGGANIAYSGVARLVTKKLLGHWKLNDAGTTAADSSTSAPSNTGTVYGTGDGPDPWTTGIDGGALVFDGNSVPGTDYVDCGSNDSLKTSMQVTVAGWYKLGTYRYYGQIAGFMFDEGSNESGYAIMTTDDEDGWIGFWITGSGGSGTYLWTSDVPAVPTGWTHVAGTYDGSTMTLYINGVEKATSTAQSGNIDYDHVNSFKIGLYESGGWWEPYEGEIDDVQLYNYALTYNEVSDLYVDPDFAGGWVCPEVDEYDVTGPTPGEPDCVVDILDMREFAEQWLGCGRTPDTACNPL